MPERNRPALGTMWERARSRPGASLIGIAIIIGAIVVGAIFLVDSFDPAGPAPESTERSRATPTALPATPTIIATPDDVRDYPPGSLAAMLAMAPDRIDGDVTGLPIEATYADLEGWLRLVGADPATASNAELASAVIPLELPGVLQTRGLSPEWRDVYGFSVRDVDQVVTTGHAPDQVVIMRGDFAPDVLYDTWVRNGYQAVEVEETTVWSLFPGDRIDLTAPASRPALGLLNNVLVVDDDLLIASARQSGMADVLQVIDGDEPSLLDHGDLEQAVVSWTEAGPPVTAILADGTILQVPASRADPALSAAEGTAVATPFADAPLPDVDLALFGLVPDSGPVATPALTVMMIYDPDDDAVTRVPGIVSSRADLAGIGGEDASWIGDVRLTHVKVTGEGENLVEARFELLSEPDGWVSLIVDRALGLLTWSNDS